MSCGIWNDNIKNRKDFCHAQIFDKIGKPISLTKAKTEVFCHAKILFKDCPDDSLKLLGIILQMVASTSGEQMGLDINKYYGFQEIIIH